MKKYDYLIVGAGLFGSVFAYEAKKKGKTCLIVDKRDHIGGNIYCEEVKGIQIHRYGAHIFHTSNKDIWNYVNSFVEFNNFINSPLANYKGEIYNLPFNMNTFNKLWGVITPEEAKAKVETQRKDASIEEPKNLEEQAISLVGTDIYEKLIKGYTEKQWGKEARELPAFIIKRLPVRFTYDNNYFNDIYQGIPKEGYTKLIEKLLEGQEVKLNTDFLLHRAEFERIADKIVFTGMIDEYYGYCFGELEYRSLRFEHDVKECRNYQGVAVMNFTEREIPYTRIIEHKHFEYRDNPYTVITKEYPEKWIQGEEPYYPVNDEKNNHLFKKYRTIADKEKRVIFGGRLGNYRYYDMHQVIEAALAEVENI